MIHELSWYLESGRFSGIVEELEKSLKDYEEVKKDDEDVEVINNKKENTRQLFEKHCVLSGLRAEEQPYVNIDAEFFNGNDLDEEAMNNFIKNIVKGHCYQKVLWTYMGTTGLMTQITKSQMIKEGRNYNNLLPIEYKKKNPVKKPLADKENKGEELFYIYGDGSISKEYNKEKAKIRFDRLEDTSGMNWNKGYDPNGEVIKNGWHGTYDKNGTWIRVEQQKPENFKTLDGNKITLEIINTENGVILYDPEMLLLNPALILFATESGEQYGQLNLDVNKTVEEIKNTITKMKAEKITAIGGIEPEKLESYKEILKNLTAKDLKMIDVEEIKIIKSEQEIKIEAKRSEKKGVELSKKLDTAIMNRKGNESVYETVLLGSMIIPLSPRRKEDGIALGLTDTEIKKINEIQIDSEDEEIFDAILSNLYAAWAVYGNSFNDKAEAAAIVNDYLKTNNIEENKEIIAYTSLKDIINGTESIRKDNSTIFTTRIPGVFSELETVNFFNEIEREKYLTALENKKILPKGGSITVTSIINSLKIKEEKKDAVNRRLTRALSQYKSISASTGIPLGELIDNVLISSGISGNGNIKALDKKVYYDIPIQELFNEAGKENLQQKVILLEKANETPAEAIIIGGVSGVSLGESELTKEKLIKEYGFSKEEAEKAEPLLRSMRFTGTSTTLPAYVHQAIRKGNVKTADDLKNTIISSLETNRAISYNLSSPEAQRIYIDNRQISENAISQSDIESLLTYEPLYTEDNYLSTLITSIEPKYRDVGSSVPLTRSVPKGLPERIYPVSSFSDMSFANFDISDKYKKSNHVNSAIDTGIEVNEIKRNNADTEIAYVGKGLAETGYGDSDNAVTLTREFTKSPTQYKDNNGLDNSSSIATENSNTSSYQNLYSSYEDVKKYLEPSDTVKDSELERLKKMEANYERDKALLIKQKQPALARSDTHDVGHAEGVEGDAGSEDEATLILRNFVKGELIDRKGI